MKRDNREPRIITGKKRLRSPGMILFSGILAVSVAVNIYLGLRCIKGDQGSPESNETPAPCPLDIIRTSDTCKKMIHPLLLAEVDAESPAFSTLKMDLIGLIQQRKQAVNVQSVSVYLRDLNNAAWMGIGGDTEYHPGSLMKVPVMIYYLKEEAERPGKLREMIRYEKPSKEFPSQAYAGDSVRPGKSYTVAELLRYMIAESDNHATYALTARIDQQRYRQFFADLEIPFYEPGNAAYAISARQYSKFLRILYNATYLGRDLSEYALDLLATCNFREGVVRGLPQGTLVAHKFGERGFNEELDFSESAVVYANDSPYLLTVMTRGKDAEAQTRLIGEISKEVFHRTRKK